MPDKQSNAPTGQRLWAVGGGKGGVGKSLFAANFALVLASLGRRVVAVDLDLGNANMHTCLGLRYPRKTLMDFINGETDDLNEILIDTSLFNLKLISGAGGIMGSANPFHAQKLKILRYIDRLKVDDVVMDLGAGTSFNIIDFFLAATNHIIVTTPETTSIQSAYNFVRIALFRKLYAYFHGNEEAWRVIESAKSPTPDSTVVKFVDMLEQLKPAAGESYDEFRMFMDSFVPRLVLNMVVKKEEAKLGHGLREVIHRYLGVTVDYAGSISYDKIIRESLAQEIPYIMNAPRSKPAVEFIDAATAIIDTNTDYVNTRDVVRREIQRRNRTYNRRIVESDSMKVDPSIYVVDRVRSHDLKMEKDSESFFSFKPTSWSKLAIDIGTSTTKIFVKGRGIVLNEPSLMSVDEDTGKIVAIGHDAKAMLGRSHSGITIINPMESGAITDYTDVKRMIQEFIRVAKKSTLLIRPGIILCLPLGLTSVERKAVQEFTNEMGARETHLIHEPMAAAVGAGLPVDMPQASLLVNVGGGSTSAILISLSGIVTYASARIGSKSIDHTLVRYLRDEHNFYIGSQTAEWVKINFAQAAKIERDRKIRISGQDLAGSIPKTLLISTGEIREAIVKPVDNMVKVVMKLLEQVPPELSGDLVDRGMTLTGGGALLKGLDTLLYEKTGIRVRISPNAQTAAVEGAGRILSNIKLFNKFFVQVNEQG